MGEHIYAQVIARLVEELEASVTDCRAAQQGPNKEALDTCLDRVFTALGATAKTYTELWSSLELGWFDHRYDWMRGPRWRAWEERGILGEQHVSRGDRVLDLCCGDGIYAGLFYAKKAALVHGVDRDARAIAVAQKYYQADHVQFFYQDALGEFPLSEYDVITCFGAIEHFSEADGEKLLGQIAQALSPKGVFVGSTVLVDEALRSLPGAANVEHDNEFESVEQLRDFLSQHFGMVDTWLSAWGSRMDMYFRCEVDG